MDSAFIYNKYVTGKNFIGRKGDCTVLGNLLAGGESVSLYAPPRSGKRSLIQQTLLGMKVAGKPFVACEFTALNIRSVQQFMLRLGSTVIRAVASTPDEYEHIVAQFLHGTHFVFDRQRFSDLDEVLSLNWDPDETDLAAAVRLPFELATAIGQPIVMIINEFQNVMRTEDGEFVISVMENVMREMQHRQGPKCSFLFTGSEVNAMKEIFEHRHFFHRLVERFDMRPLDGKEIAEHIVKGLLATGKVIDKDHLLGICQMFGNSPWYINHFASICDSMSKGYITDSLLMDAFGKVLSIHEPRFRATVSDLTTYQLNLLNAIIDGHRHFNSADVIRHYNLSSSANTRRLKDALMKKEIVTFDQDGTPHIMDPLFKYWVAKYYFGKKS